MRKNNVNYLHLILGRYLLRKAWRNSPTREQIELLQLLDITIASYEKKTFGN